MKTTTVRVIAQKEIAAILRSRALWVPMVIVNVILFVVVPVGIGLVTSSMPENALRDPEMMKVIDALPDMLRDRFVSDDLRETMFFLMLGQLLVPLFLIAPIMTASLVAADAFAGERERKTLEALLYSPATSLEIFVGKVTGSLVPALIIDVTGFVLFVAAANGVCLPVFAKPFVPTVLHVSVAFLLGPATAALAVVLVVAVSARVKGAQEANQVAALLVIPVVGLLIGQVAGVAFLGPFVIVGLALVVALVAAISLRALARRFTRERLFRSI
jgi:ABC-2 type transport system permease protein